ncbi:MAG: hypothetical protein JXJ17_16820 [Anaerolineae bacterium]|nr:hypothetical protein [Anaerolineae bacterium]
MRRFWQLIPCLIGLMLLLSGCAGGSVSQDDLFPYQVGDYLRTGGPAVEATSGADVATYRGPDGSVTLRVRLVGADQVDEALNGLPVGSTEVGYDASLGVRQGTFFLYGGEYHAAWGNEDWVFVLSATSDMSRRAFLAAYGF